MKMNFFSLGMIILLLAGQVLIAQQPDKGAKEKEAPPGQLKKTEKKAQQPDNKDRGKGNEKKNIEEPGRSDDMKMEKEGRKAKIRGNEDKVTICHKGDGLEEPVTIRISRSALDAHLAHGDVAGECSFPANEPEGVLRKREIRSTYYTTAAEAEELITIARQQVDEAQRRVAAAEQRLATLNTQADAGEDLLKEKENIIVRVRQLAQEVEQEAVRTEQQLQEQRQILARLEAQ